MFLCRITIHRLLDTDRYEGEPKLFCSIPLFPNALIRAKGRTKRIHEKIRRTTQRSANKKIAEKNVSRRSM